MTKVNTNQLQNALANVAGRLAGKASTGSDVALEKLNVKNIYIGRDNKVHVSNSGFAANNWLGKILYGAKLTGEEALKTAMSVQFKNSPDKLIDRALAKITEFDAKHATWERNSEAVSIMIMNQTPEAEPKSTLQKEISSAVKEIITEVGEARQEIAAAKTKTEAAFAEKLKGSEIKLDSTQTQLAEKKVKGFLSKLAMKPLPDKLKVIYQGNNLQTIPEKISDAAKVKNEIKNEFKAEVDSIQSELDQLMAGYSAGDYLDDEKLEAAKEKLSDLGVELGKVQSKATEAMYELDESEQAIAEMKESIAAKTVVAHDDAEKYITAGIWKFEDSINNIVMNSRPGEELSAKDLFDNGRDIAQLMVEMEPPKNSSAPSNQGIAYITSLLNPLAERLASCNFSNEQLKDVIRSEIPALNVKFLALQASGKNEISINMEMAPILDEKLGAYMKTTEQQFNFYAGQLFTNQNRQMLVDEGILPTGRDASEQDVQNLKKILTERNQSGLTTQSSGEAYDAYRELKASLN